MANLKKQDMLPGLIIEIRSDRPLRNGLGGMPFLPSGGNWDQQIPSVRVQSLGRPGKSDFQLSPSDTCEIVKGPRRVNESNVIEVKNSQGDVGYVFWCEFRVNGLISPTNLTLSSTSSPKP